MQTFKRFLLPIVVFALFGIFFLVAWLVPSSETLAPAEFDIPLYKAEYVVHEDLRVDVEEHISVHFFTPRHGLIRDLPLEQGVRYENVSAKRDGENVPTEFRNDSAAYLSLAVGDEDGQLLSEATYDFFYTMYLPARGDGVSLDVLGFGWNASVDTFSATVTVPDGLLRTQIFSGKSGTTSDRYNVRVAREGNTVVLSAEGTDGEGITLDLAFEAGALRPAADLTPLWAVLIVLGLGAVFVLLKLTLCRAPLITRTVNLTTPDDMDPLLMGTLIDNRPDTEDLGAVVFWLADRGYLTIDFSDGDDPLLRRTEKSPDDLPAHIRPCYDGLFLKGSEVRVSGIKDTFYPSAEAAKRLVRGAAGEAYSDRGKGAAIALGILCALASGAFALLWNLFRVGTGYYYIMMFFVCAAAYAIPAAFSYTAERLRNKWKPWKRILLLCGSFLLGCLPAVVGVFMQSAALTLWGRLVLAVGCAVLGTLSGSLFVYTEKHAEKLGHILGFRDFILYTERDKIEFMLKDNPELYYRILPYAQVLGVTDAWTEKFEGLDLRPPVYASSYDGLFTALVFRNMFFRINVDLSRNMVSRPAPSGGGGGHFGGFGGGGGGFGGGGFGGGGGRAF